MGKRNLNALREQKQLKALNEKIILAITQGKNLRTTFESENKDYLKKASNLPIAEGRYLLEFAILFLSQDPRANTAHTLTLLEWGANPNQPNDNGIYPFETMFLIDMQPGRLPPNYRFKYLEVVKGFIQAGADLTIIGANGLSLIHYAASTSREAMQLLLEHIPDKVNALDRHGETPVFSAIRLGNNAAAMELILNKQIDLNHQAQSGVIALDTALYFPNPTVAQILLTNGSSINVQSSVVIKTGLSEEDMLVLKKLFMVLMKAGYYIFVRSGHDKLISKCYKEHFDNKNDNPFLFVLEDEKTKTQEFITSIKALEDAKAMISLSQSRRLHQSFLEVLAVYKGRYDSIYLEIQSLYEVFCKKYPCPDGVKAPALLIENSKISPRSLKDLRSCITEITEKAGNDLFVHQVSAHAKQMLKQNKNIILTTEAFLLETADFKNIWREGMMTITDEKLDKRPFHLFLDAITFKYTFYVVLNYIRHIKTHADLRATYDEILFFVILCINANAREKAYYFHETVFIMDNLLDVLNKFQASPDMKARLMVLKQLCILLNYVEMHCYNEMIVEIKNIFKCEQGLDLIVRNLLKKGNENQEHSIVSILNKILSSVLDKIDTNKISISAHHKILNAMEDLAMRFTLENLRNKSRDHKKIVLEHCKMLLQPSLNKLTTNLIHSTNVEYGSLIIRFHDDASKAKIKSYFVDQGVICADGALFYIPLDEKNISKVIQCVGYLNSYTLDEFKRAEQAKPLRDCVYEEKPWYDAQPTNHSSSSSSTRNSSFATDVKGKGKIPTPDQASENFEHKCSAIKQEIAEKYHIGSENVFLINAPWLPQSRKHAAWGVWKEISGERAETLSQQTLDRHKNIALQGKVCSKALGDSGLKVTEDNASSTGKTVLTLKTKALSTGEAGDLRVVSTPENFQSISDEQPLTVYRFGRTSFHS